ncbi:MAG: AraC family transcriptional regulator [Clostridiales bacterium]|nr:AraC family transcriptional regulator [Clostridiales bacterium]
MPILGGDFINSSFFETYSIAEQSKMEIIEMAVTTPVVRHAHNYLELAYIKQGWTKHTRNNDTQKLTAGEYMILDYGEVHSYDVVSDDLVVINCLFKPEFIDNTMIHCRSFPEMLSNYMINIGYLSGAQMNNSIFQDNQDEILSLLTKMKQEDSVQKTGHIQVIRAALIEIIIKTMRQVQDNATADIAAYDKDILEIISLVSQSPNSNISLSEIARRQNVCVSNLSRKFKVTTGHHFSEFLQQKRIEQACRLLINTNDKISEVAEKSGYNDVKFFHTVFKHITGQTPAQYRKSFSISYIK